MVIYRDNGTTKRQQRTANDPGLFVELRTADQDSSREI
jgi:hypothetical protein